MDIDYIIGIVAIVLGGGTILQIPSAIMNFLQKKMTVIDNWLIAQAGSAKDAEHQASWNKIRQDIDNSYTQIAKGSISVMTAWAVVKNLEDAYYEWMEYELPVLKEDVTDDIALLKADIAMALKEIRAIKLGPAPVPPAPVPVASMSTTGAPEVPKA